MVSSSSPQGDRRSRLAAERGDQPSAPHGGEILESRRSRREEASNTGAMSALSTGALKIIGGGKKKKARKAQVASGTTKSGTTKSGTTKRARQTSYQDQPEVVSQLVPGPATSPHGIDLYAASQPGRPAQPGQSGQLGQPGQSGPLGQPGQRGAFSGPMTGPLTTQLPRVARPGGSGEPESRSVKRSTPRTDAIRMENLRTGSIPAVGQHPEFHLSDEDEIGHGRRAGRPGGSRRRAELALGRAVSNRRVVGITLTVLLVLLVPGASMLTKAVTVADSGLNSDGTGDNLKGLQVLPTDSPTTPGPTATADPTATPQATATKTAKGKGKEKPDAKSTTKAKQKHKPKPGGSGGNAPAPGTGSTSQITDGASGLGWASGAYIPGSSPTKIREFGDWRGAGMDVATDWENRKTWDDITNPDWLLNAWRGTPYTKVFGVAPVPEDDGSATMAGCANGDYNDKWRTFGQNFKNAGLDNGTVIRLGWEFNGDWYKWKASNPGQFAECWRQIVGTVRQVAPKLLWDWNPNRGVGQSVADARDAYPGDSYVDIVGVDSYDDFPGATDESSWAEHYSGAYGLKFWVDFAKQHGKKFSVPEWGIYPGPTAKGNSGGDNPYYIEKMHSFFQSVGSELAFESYFNESAAYYAGSLFGPNQNPSAAAKYASLFH